jgi:xanthine permease XanP
MAGLPFVNIPIPFNYGFAINGTAFIGVAFIYFITTIESTGDLTATSMLSGETC